MIQRRAFPFVFTVFFIAFLLEISFVIYIAVRLIADFFVIGLLFLVPLLAFSFLFLVWLNITGSIVYIDRSRRRIGRRGWLWGYRFEMNFEDIKEVVIAQVNCASVIYVKDEFHHCYFMGFKQSYIRIQYSEKNMAFIRRAWGGPITEKRDDFFYTWKN